MSASSLARCQRAILGPCSSPWIISSGRDAVRTSQLNASHTTTITSTISAGTTNNWMMNPADGGSTGGSKSSPAAGRDAPADCSCPGI